MEEGQVFAVIHQMVRPNRKASLAPRYRGKPGDWEGTENTEQRESISLEKTPTHHSSKALDIFL